MRNLRGILTVSIPVVSGLLFGFLWYFGRKKPKQKPIEPLKPDSENHDKTKTTNSVNIPHCSSPAASRKRKACQISREGNKEEGDQNDSVDEEMEGAEEKMPLMESEEISFLKSLEEEVLESSAIPNTESTAFVDMTQNNETFEEKNKSESKAAEISEESVVVEKIVPVSHTLSDKGRELSLNSGDVEKSVSKSCCEQVIPVNETILECDKSVLLNDAFMTTGISEQSIVSEDRPGKVEDLSLSTSRIEEPLLESTMIDNSPDRTNTESQKAKSGSPEHRRKTRTSGSSDHMTENVMDRDIRDSSSESSNDSGKGRSVAGTLSPGAGHSTPTGSASPSQLTYHFNFPSFECGRLIGRNGRNINIIKEKSGANISLTANPFTTEYQLCVVEGNQKQIDIALDCISRKFPEVDLTPIALPNKDSSLPQAPVLMPEIMQVIPDIAQLNLPEGVSVDVVVSSIVDTGHLFLQQPTHPSFPSLERLNQFMNVCYHQNGVVPQLPRPIEIGVICAAPLMDTWYRAQITAVYDDTDECDIKYVDYGGFSRTTGSSLRQIRSDFMTLPFQACECYLGNVTPLQDEEYFSGESAAVLEELTQGKMLQAQVVGRSDDGVPYVHIYQINGDKVFKSFEGDLERFGQRVATEINELGLQCEREPPRVEHYDAWGRRVDRLITSPAWRKQHDIAAEEGLITIAYERQFKEWSRLYQMAKLYLFSPSSGLYSCPLAMTDGAAKIIEGISKDYPWLMNGPYQHLVSRDPSQFWTSGQWMTERGGGSDVASGTETYAIAQGDGSYHLHGYKWFSSATDSDMTFTLARVVDNEGQFVKGTKGLSLFYLETRDKNGDTNGIHIQKLKNKLGTRQLPTAELLLDGAVAFKVSDEGRGVAGISNMLTISRLHNSMSSASIMRRILNLARDYATRRRAFGNLLKDYPLHIQTLARLEVEARAATLLTLEIARYLGREDNGIATEQDQMMIRLLTPLAKLYTGKQAMSVVSEGIESFGGQGYIEDTGIPVMLRDAQVLTIWEGTTNILSLDVLRAVIKTQGKVLMAFKSDVDEKLKAAESQTQLTDDVNRVRTALDNVIEFAVQNQDKMELAARDFSFSLARIYIGALLLDHAVGCGMRPTDIYMAKRWCEKDLCLVLTNNSSQQYDDAVKQQDFSLVFEDYTQTDRL
ncbi:hypothetical protein FSP39_006649 [Pinctada imbricata]|uniref:Tudor domain-containing protein n=1 Tax=Pinctada imbricata TaxID=66713 RepID=A0AA89BLP4_PINIB|nr:hypothetical protein FSP39_006649 [Pinctada imbricata]